MVLNFAISQLPNYRHWYGYIYVCLYNVGKDDTVQRTELTKLRVKKSLQDINYNS